MYLYPAGDRLLLRAAGKAEMQEPENWLKGGAMIKVIDNKIYRRQDKELLVIEPWGPDSLRVRATQNLSLIHIFPDTEGTSKLNRRGRKHVQRAYQRSENRGQGYRRR